MSDKAKAKIVTDEKSTLEVLREGTDRLFDVVGDLKAQYVRIKIYAQVGEIPVFDVKMGGTLFVRDEE